MMTTIGLHKAKRILQKLKSSSTGVHAVLLYGPEGAGKSLLARELTEYWLENQRAIDAYERGSNPDVLKIEPMGTSRIIRLHQIKPPTPQGEPPVAALTDFLRGAPLYSQHKVACIHDADRMNATTSNSLLKPLEEPPEYAKIILLTHAISQVKQTILSRCLVVACELPSDQELAEVFGSLPEQLQRIGGLAPGQLKLIEDHREFFEKILTFANDLSVAKPSQVLRLSDGVRALSEEMDGILKMGARAANAKVIELVSQAIAAQSPERADIILELADAHRKIVGNGASNLVFDAAFSRILVK